MSAVQYRVLQVREEYFLKEMLYEALFVPDGQKPFHPSILENPNIRKYISNWGRDDNDIAIVAMRQDQLIGAIWGRSFKLSNSGYGYVDDHTPEISMAVKEGFRNMGIGNQLLSKIEEAYFNLSVRQLSLSVDIRNRAIHLYKRRNYQEFKTEGSSATLVKQL